MSFELPVSYEQQCQDLSHCIQVPSNISLLASVQHVQQRGIIYAIVKATVSGGNAGVACSVMLSCKGGLREISIAEAVGSMSCGKTVSCHVTGQLSRRLMINRVLLRDLPIVAETSGSYNVTSQLSRRLLLVHADCVWAHSL